MIQRSTHSNYHIIIINCIYPVYTYYDNSVEIINMITTKLSQHDQLIVSQHICTPETLTIIEKLKSDPTNKLFVILIDYYTGAPTISIPCYTGKKSFYLVPLNQIRGSNVFAIYFGLNKINCCDSYVFNPDISICNLTKCIDNNVGSIIQTSYIMDIMTFTNIMSALFTNMQKTINTYIMRHTFSWYAISISS